ncbi:MAG: hypothetical protein H6553_09925 [Chitinophagales bacterium]|nr:hypothetical protein [Chitinophagales bacterium]
MNKCTTLLLFLILALAVNAKDSTATKRIIFDDVHILFDFNYGVFAPTISQHDIFQGVLNENNPTWTDRNNVLNLKKDYKTSNVNLNMQVNFIDNWYTGMHYQFFTIKDYKINPDDGNLLSQNNAMFFMLGFKNGYVFRFLKNKNLHIHPSFTIGSYTADDYYDNIGKKIYFNFQNTIRYLIKNKFGFQLNTQYDYLRYKEKGFSEQFNQSTYKKVSFNNFHLSVGFVYQINILLDK